MSVRLFINLSTLVVRHTYIVSLNTRLSSYDLKFIDGISTPFNVILTSQKAIINSYIVSYIQVSTLHTSRTPVNFAGLDRCTITFVREKSLLINNK